jgi:hypothetical protein
MNRFQNILIEAESYIRFNELKREHVRHGKHTNGYIINAIEELIHQADRLTRVIHHAKAEDIIRIAIEQEDILDMGVRFDKRTEVVRSNWRRQAKTIRRAARHLYDEIVGRNLEVPEYEERHHKIQVTKFNIQQAFWSSKCSLNKLKELFEDVESIKWQAWGMQQDVHNEACNTWDHENQFGYYSHLSEENVINIDDLREELRWRIAEQERIAENVAATEAGDVTNRIGGKNDESN